MSARRLFRFFLSLVVLAILWTRAIRDWQSRSGPWLAVAIVMSLLVLVAVVVEVSGVTRRRPRDEVPKKPLGLDT